MANLPRALPAQVFAVAPVWTTIVKLDVRNTKWLSIQVDNQDSLQTVDVNLLLSSREDNNPSIIDPSPSGWAGLIGIPPGESWCADYEPGAVRIVEVVARASGIGAYVAFAINNKEITA